MTTGIALQTTVGGSRTVVLLALAGLVLAAALSLLVVYRLVEGYRRNGTRPMLVLGVGLALLVTGPIFLRLALTNVVSVSPATRSVATTASELLGLAAILYAIYDP
jgi:Na+/H+ antiporter NhaC